MRAARMHASASASVRVRRRRRPQPRPSRWRSARRHLWSLLKGCRRVWHTRRPDPRRGPMGLRRRDWRRPRPPPRMARTTKLYPATADRRRTAAAAGAAAYPAGRRHACTSSAAGPGPSSSRGWRPPPSDGTQPRRWPRDDGYRGDSRPRPCAAPGSPGPRSARRDYPRSRRRRRCRTACRPSPTPAPPPAAANSRSETKGIRSIDWLLINLSSSSKALFYSRRAQALTTLSARNYQLAMYIFFST